MLHLTKAEKLLQPCCESLHWCRRNAIAAFQSRDWCQSDPRLATSFRLDLFLKIFSQLNQKYQNRFFAYRDQLNV